MRAFLIFLLATLTLTACGGDDPLTATTETFLVGVASRDITPSQRVYLGGYGFGRERLSTGTLAPINVRALVVSDGTQTVAFVQSDTQGAPAAYKRGPFGLTDIAAQVEQATQGQIPREHVVISSGHTHSGPDTTGVWGGLPNDYLTFIAAQTVAAITDAFDARRPARLWTGVSDAHNLLRSQFSEPPNDAVSGDLRVLLAVDADNPAHRRALLINFAAHATVMGPSNTLISGDWPAAVVPRVEQALPVDAAIVMIADCGRTQPNRDLPAGPTEPDKLDAYADAVTERVIAASIGVAPVRGTRVDAAQLFVRELYANTFFPIDLLKGVIARSNLPPWVDGETVGTVVSAARLGDTFFAAVPGEAYPAILSAVREQVPAGRHFLFGLANDQLGYLIAPESGYQQIADAAPDNDNAIFNVSPAIGDHITCTLLKAARRVGFGGRPDPSYCQAYAAEDNALPF